MDSPNPKQSISDIPSDSEQKSENVSYNTDVRHARL